MFAGWTDFFQTLFTGPVWPASLLVSFLLLYSLLLLGGLLDYGLEVPEAEAGGVDWIDTGSSLGAVTIRWLNLSSLPVFVWLVIFALLWWLLSLGIWVAYDRQHHGPPTLGISLLLATRNLVIAVGLTKIVTNPLRKWFAHASPYRPEQIVGHDCEIETGEASPTFGRVRFRTRGAPLLLNVRTTGEILRKGERARIVDYDPETTTYIVQSSSAKAP